MPSYDFDASEVEPMEDAFAPVPPGWYSAMVMKSELKETKAGNGKYFNLTFSILGPSHQKRVIFQMFMVEHPNATAVRIGKSRLKSMSESVGVPKWSSSEELHMLPVGIKVKIKPAQGGYDASNEVVEFCSEEALDAAIADGAEKHDSMVAPSAPWKGSAPVAADDDDTPF